MNGVSIFLLEEVFPGMNGESMSLLVEAFPGYQLCIHALTW